MDGPAPAIRLTELRKLYGGRPAVDGLSLEVPRGCFFGFLGPNGAGKTTTIKLLTGLIYPSSGTATLFGKAIDSPEARRMVGYMPEQPYFYEYLTPRETLDFYGRLRGLSGAARQKEWDYISELLDLRGHEVRALVVLPEGVRQAGIRIGADQRVGDTGQLRQMGPHRRGAEGAVEADREGPRMPDRMPEGGRRLPGQRPA